MRDELKSKEEIIKTLKDDSSQITLQNKQSKGNTVKEKPRDDKSLTKDASNKQTVQRGNFRVTIGDDFDDIFNDDDNPFITPSNKNKKRKKIETERQLLWAIRQ